MRRLTATMLLALCALLLISISAAQQPSTLSTTTSTSVPNLIRYSGALKDAQGAALTSTTPVGVMFAIYNQQDGGAAVWQETQNVIPDSSGQYNVILGSTTATGLPGDLFSQEEQRWLGVQVQGQEEQPRVLMVSVPYALKAHEADTLGGMPASAFIQAATLGAGGVTSANGTSVNALSSAGNPAGARGKDGKLPPNGCLEVSGYVTFWNINGALCPSQIFQKIGGVFNGYIGIGTTNPSTPLEVAGAITADKWYDITTPNEFPFLSIGWPGTPVVTNQNTWLGVYAGGQGTANTSDAGINNTFVGFDAAQHNLGGSSNIAVGVNSGFHNSNGNNNTSVGVSAGFSVLFQDVNNTTIMGYQAGVNNTASNVAFYGYKAGAANTANGNSFYGYTAGTANTSGSSDTFLGNLAGAANTTGNGNTFVGDSAGTTNVTGNNNTFTGQNAGKANTANGNSFYGYNSGPVNNTGIQNVFMGWQTGLVNTTGTSNVFMGYQAGQANIDQSYNTFVGANAGYSSDAGGNTLMGYSAGSNTNSATGYGITAVGYDAGRANTTGTLNAYFGVNAGFNGVGSPPATGSQNTYLGNGAGSSANLGNGSNNIFVGFAAGNAENQVNNNIEIGNAGPAPLSTHPTILIGVEGVQTDQTYIAGIYQQQSLTGTRSVVIDALGHLGTTTGGGGSNVMGNCTDPTTGTYLTGWVGSGLTNMVTCSFLFQQNTTNFIGIGTINPSTALDVNGDINALLDKSSYQIGESTVLSAFGDRNTFVGFGATPPNCVYGTGTCAQNTFTGNLAGNANTTGTLNSFYGSAAGPSNTGGTGNTCIGQEACRDLQNGNNDTYVGVGAGYLSNVNGSSNTYVGAEAGSGNTNGNSNIYLENGGTSESNTIRIGTQGTGNGQQNATYIAGIYNKVSADPTWQVVCIDSTGMLFTVPANGDPCVYGESQKDHKTVKSQQDELQTQLQQIKAQQQEIDGLKLQLRQQNASFQERLSKLESYVATQMKTASDVQPATTASSNGGGQ